MHICNNLKFNQTLEVHLTRQTFSQHIYTLLEFMPDFYWFDWIRAVTGAKVVTLIELNISSYIQEPIY